MLNAIFSLLGDLVLLAMIAMCAYFIYRAFYSRSADAKLSAHEKRRYQGICPECGYDLRSGHEWCPECGGPGRERLERDAGHLDRRAMLEDWPSKYVPIRKPNHDERPTLAHETDSPGDAIFLARQYEARGIRAWIQRERGARRDPTGHTRYQRRVMVWSADLDRALHLLRRFDPAAPTLSPESGANVEPAAASERDPEVVGSASEGATAEALKKTENS